MAKESEFTVNQHFEGKSPVVREIYDKVLSELRRNGAVMEEAKKTSIHLVNSSAAAGVATRRNGLILTIKSTKEIKSKRIKKSERVSANRYHSEMLLELSSDVDEEVAGWLKAAYEMSA